MSLAGCVYSVGTLSWHCVLKCCSLVHSTIAYVLYMSRLVYWFELRRWSTNSFQDMQPTITATWRKSDVDTNMWHQPSLIGSSLRFSLPLPCCFWTCWTRIRSSILNSNVRWYMLGLWNMEKRMMDSYFLHYFDLQWPLKNACCWNLHKHSGSVELGTEIPLLMDLVTLLETAPNA